MKLVTYDRSEFIGDVPFGLDSVQTLPTQGGLLPNERFLYGLRLAFEMRVTNPAANFPTGQQAQLQEICQRIEVSGYHKPRKVKEVFYSVRGADAFNLNQLYLGTTPKVQILVNGAAAAALSNAANATNDIRFFIDVVFPPEQIVPEEQLGYLLDCPNYEQLALKITWGSDKSIFTGQTTAPTFTAFGSAVGSPRCRVTGLFAQGGIEKFAGFVPARVWRTSQDDKQDSDMTAGKNGARLFNLPKGYDIRSIYVKTGVKSAAVNPTENVFNTLSDTIIGNYVLNQGLNNIIRQYHDQFAVQEEVRNSWLSPPIVGVALFDFCRHGRLFEALPTKGLITGPTGNIDLFLQGDVVGAAAQAMQVVVQELRGRPIFPKKAA